VITRWEHKAITPQTHYSPEQEVLDRMGAEGWELVGVLPSNDGGLSVARLYFKRPVLKKRVFITMNGDRITEP